MPCVSNAGEGRRGGRFQVCSWARVNCHIDSSEADMTPLQPVSPPGGSGTRLWPLSREAYPKQFLPLVGNDTMLQATWQRVQAIASCAPIVVAGEDHRFLVAEQLRQIGAPTPAIVLEPMGRVAILRRPLLRPRCKRYCARTRYCWCCHPIMWCAMPQRFVRPYSKALPAAEAVRW